MAVAVQRHIKHGGWGAGQGRINLPLGPQDKIDLLDLQKPFFTLDIFNQN